MEDFATYKVADFKRELKARGLSTGGTKTELLTRLQAAIATEKSGLEDSSVMDDSLIDEDSMLEDEDESGSDVDSSNENSTDSPVNLSSPTKTPDKKDPGTNITPATTIAPPNIQSLSAEKAQNGDQSGIPPKKKKITINRLPVQTPPQPAATEVPPPEPAPPVPATNTTDALTVGKVVKLSVATAAVDKIKSRQEKFGSAVSVTNSSIVPPGPVAEKLKKRADRFGSASSTGSGGAIGKVSLTAEDEVKLAKRKERFGIQLADEKNAVASAAKEKRNARFGGGVAVATVSTPEIEERKIKRAARFATAT